MPFGSLWLPVIVSAVAVFVASSILHMALRYHNADYKGLPDEDGLRAALGKQKPTPATYMVPYCSDHKQMKDPDKQRKFEDGPIALITVMPNGLPKMGKHLALWFGLCVLVSFLAGYVARHTLHAGDQGLLAMRVTTVVAFGCYGISHISDSVWKAQPWGNTVRALIDAAIYAVVTGLVFRLLWPAA